jgi:hypothetical protein
MVGSVGIGVGVGVDSSVDRGVDNHDVNVKVHRATR